MTTLEKVIATIKREVGDGEYTAESQISAMGIDSLEFMSLMLAIQNECGGEITDKQYVNLETIGDIMNALEVGAV